jgi:hypothetical protein
MPDGIAEFFRNDTLVRQSQYSIIANPSRYDARRLLQVAGTDDSDKLITFRGNDTLILIDNSTDAFYVSYSRIAQ